MLNTETSAIIKSSDRKLLNKTIKYTLMGNQFERPVIVLDPTNSAIRLVSDVVTDFSGIWIFSCVNPVSALGALDTVIKKLSKDSILIIDHTEVFCKDFLSQLYALVNESKVSISVLAMQLISDDTKAVFEQEKVTEVQKEVLSINTTYVLTGSSYLSLVGDNLSAKTGFLI